MYGYNIFHDDVMLELINNVHEGIFHQAYIFEGPEGLNIKEAAKLFATALTCRNKKTAPCTSCEVCRLSYADTNPDIIYINTADKKSIGVDRIREISKDVYVRPFESDCKVYIIENGASLTDEAQNAMLKILEEPPEYAVFIIITTSSSILLPTVLSRSNTIRFSPLSEEKMRAYITKKYPEITTNVEFFARFSEGIPKRVEDIINNPDFEPLRKESFNMLIPLLSKHLVSAYTITEFLEENKDNAKIIFDLWLSFLRDVLLLEMSASHLLVNTDMKENLSKLALKLPEEYCIFAINRLISAKTMLKRYVNLHVLALNLSFSIKNFLHNS